MKKQIVNREFLGKMVILIIITYFMLSRHWYLNRQFSWVNTDENIFRV
jgi:hypothetical protein